MITLEIKYTIFKIAFLLFFSHFFFITYIILSKLLTENTNSFLLYLFMFASFFNHLLGMIFFYVLFSKYRDFYYNYLFKIDIYISSFMVFMNTFCFFFIKKSTNVYLEFYLIFHFLIMFAILLTISSIMSKFNGLYQISNLNNEIERNENDIELGNNEISDVNGIQTVAVILPKFSRCDLSTNTNDIDKFFDLNEKNIIEIID